VVADLDLISETFFRLRGQKDMGLEFDNITFVLNCVDVLAGDTSYVELRKRRGRHRTLARLEESTKEYVDAAQKETEAAEEAAAAGPGAGRDRLRRPARPGEPRGQPESAGVIGRRRERGKHKAESTKRKTKGRKR